MDFGTALVVIAGIGAIYSMKSQRLRAGGFGRNRHRHDAAAAEQLTATASPRETELQKEVESLRERIHVLERIATDGRQTRNLADEIESLRDR